ncbi:MAG: hypothetical protein BRC30_00170 [Nanohaloarchaea archaeon SW_7_46_7]|nr:MAG: hypothetical protein BRC30_00170 [Nanohaloarchaea archaeon SW_7_46_7]
MVLDALTRKDKGIILGGLVALLASSTISMILGFGIKIEALGDIALAVSGAFALYYVYNGIKLVGGVAGRALALVAVSVGYYAIYILPHLYWHITGVRQVGPVKGPAIETFFHASTAVIFFVAAYGFKVFYEGGKE